MFDQVGWGSITAALAAACSAFASPPRLPSRTGTPAPGRLSVVDNVFPAGAAVFAVCSVGSSFESVCSYSDFSSRPASPFSVLRTECEDIGDDSAWFASFFV